MHSQIFWCMENVFIIDFTVLFILDYRAGAPLLWSSLQVDSLIFEDESMQIINARDCTELLQVWDRNSATLGIKRIDILYII